jgi:solute carrier family 27 fatty acid transporter 1/4
MVVYPTGTFKLQKVELQKEGFDVTKIKDKMYFYDGDRYIPMDKELHTKVVTGLIRV